MSAQTSKFAPLPGYSRNAINRAGARLREWLEGDNDRVPLDVVEAFEAMVVFRESFQAPLNKTVNGLRSMVRSECPAI